MKEKYKGIISIITNTLDGISNIIIGIAVICFFVSNIQNSMVLFQIYSIIYLLSCSLKLINNKKDNKKLTYCGIGLFIFALLIGGYIIVNIIKWNI